MRPHRRQPTRFPCPWDSLGKNTGVGCHCLLQCIKVKSESEVAQSCPTLSDPMDCSLTGSSVHGIFQQEYWSGLPLPSPEITRNIFPKHISFLLEKKASTWGLGLVACPLRETVGFPGGSDGKESACNAGGLGLIPELGRSPGGRNGNSLQYFCLENLHGQRSLVGSSPWGHNELDTTEQLSTQHCGRWWAVAAVFRGPQALC